MTATEMTRAWLESSRIPFVAVDEAKKALFNGAKLKSFHFVVYSATGKNWLILCRSRQRSTDDIREMRSWQDIFGDGFQAVFGLKRPTGLQFMDLDGNTLQTDHFAPMGEGKPRGKPAPTPPESTQPDTPSEVAPPAPSDSPKTSGQQLGMFGERFDGPIAGKQSGQLFGDVSPGPANELEKLPEPTPLERKFQSCQSGVLL